MSDPRVVPDQSIFLSCVRCGREVALPPVSGKPGYVSIVEVEGWTAPPPRCPECSREPNATRRYACGLDAEAEDTCEHCPDPDGCIDRSYVASDEFGAKADG